MKLDKETIKWLRIYGYTLNNGDERFEKIKNKLKEMYPYEYYFYIDLDIKRESEEYALSYQAVYENQKEYWRVVKKRIREYKKKQIKELYGLKNS
ncbi:hypothetical protein [Romboutsia ilealis]|uniref:hypothetical protein n=1 Tax=Romboutsia ilealis TaxID=1115758 RepID=UPI00259CF41A|nr:hypothetical protein [Romboutsia ilealis]